MGLLSLGACNERDGAALCQRLGPGAAGNAPRRRAVGILNALRGGGSLSACFVRLARESSPWCVSPNATEVSQMNGKTAPIYVGCAGWSLPREQWPQFPPEGTHLLRYAQCLTAVEINSSFYRPHRQVTYEKWAASVSEGFRFSVKLPKSITHQHRLRDCEGLLDEFLGQCAGLGEKLGCLLIQLPPSFAFDAALVEDFFASLRARYEGSLALEPRHASWKDAEALLQQARVARVAADPAPFEGSEQPAGWAGLQYWRLHGSPRIYYSAYSTDWLERLAQQLQTARENGIASWCIFDNTASGAAVANALQLQQLLRTVSAG
jgi:uncharacterized protein YecE (DUF72 family)